MENSITKDNFQDIFKNYFGPLCNYVNSYIRNWEDSREIVQGTFLKIWENKETIAIDTSVKSYLYSAVRNRMIDFIRSDKKKNEYLQNLDFNEGEERVEELNSFLIRQEILRSLEKLKPKMKQIFSLSKIEGLTYSEIASYLNISKRAVEDNVARALILIKEDLKNNETIFGQ